MRVITYSELATLLGPAVCEYMNDRAVVLGEDQVANVVRGLNELLAAKEKAPPP